eukprot:GHVP01014671.1.p1 GENE.GHVP01014671.1~~GHVP01014671.1.p1  ORF type:complete len:107 (-),score=5.21 GHVP01014671.1:1770-2090(-)
MQEEITTMLALICLFSPHITRLRKSKCTSIPTLSTPQTRRHSNNSILNFAQAILHIHVNTHTPPLDIPPIRNNKWTHFITYSSNTMDLPATTFNNSAQTHGHTPLL